MNIGCFSMPSELYLVCVLVAFYNRTVNSNGTFDHPEQK